MSKQLLIALALIAFVVLILLANTGGRAISVSLGFYDIKRLSQAMAFFSFTLIGVVIGLLLK